MVIKFFCYVTNISIKIYCITIFVKQNFYNIFMNSLQVMLDEHNFSYLDPDKRLRVSDNTLKLIQKQALLDYYQRHNHNEQRGSNNNQVKISPAGSGSGPGPGAAAAGWAPGAFSWQRAATAAGGGSPKP